MITKRTAPWWLAVTLAASAVLVTGCSAAIDPDALPGTYRDDDSGGEILLSADGTFTATGISPEDAVGLGGTEPVDFHGTWEFVESGSARDFVYLGIEDDGLGDIGGIQLYTKSQEALEFNPDPDGPPSLVLDKAS